MSRWGISFFCISAPTAGRGNSLFVSSRRTTTGKFPLKRIPVPFCIIDTDAVQVFSTAILNSSLQMAIEC